MRPIAPCALAATTELAARAMSPLVDNALRHATSRVTVSASVADRTASIHVSDDGPGLVGDPETLFGAGARDDSSPGAGLGLLTGPAGGQDPRWAGRRDLRRRSPRPSP